MAEIECLKEHNIDLALVKGSWTDADMIPLAQFIAAKRQQGCKRLLFLGHETTSIQANDWALLLGPIRIFRSLGGILAFAEFNHAHETLIKNTSWRRHINLFRTKEEAFMFLQPKNRD